ncbi:GNAT family N-acetyltransferase [Bradyrhizobium sp. 2TAF24]|uniref:GNAT family N-acetyltransferase n=1 Tax=Bradyrhizobium sp. 2TAF24 TaxID=3233011 RepID=UPI003F93CB36
MIHILRKVTTDADWRDYHALRRMVLWEAKGRRGYDDRHVDEYHPAHHPLLLTWNGRAIGTTRLDDFGDGTGAVRLVAIAAERQRHGHGRVLSARVEDFARGRGVGTLYVNAAPEAVGYYDKMGWERFVWSKAELASHADGCVQMRKVLPTLS